jgi:hypothetical protein
MGKYATHMAALETLNRQAVPKAEAELAQMWGGEAAVKANVAEIRSFLNDPQRINPDLAKAIRTARAPSGVKLVNIPQYADLMLRLAKGQPNAPHQPSQATRSKGDAVSEEIVRLENLMAEDIGAYHNKRWETAGVTASERYHDLMRQQAKTTEAPAVVLGPEVASEEAELESLLNADVQAYQSRPWRDTGVTASQRAYDLAKLRAKK